MHRRNELVGGMDGDDLPIIRDEPIVISKHRSSLENDGRRCAVVQRRPQTASTTLIEAERERLGRGGTWGSTLLYQHGSLLIRTGNNVVPTEARRPART